MEVGAKFIFVDGYRFRMGEGRGVVMAELTCIYARKKVVLSISARGGGGCKHGQVGGGMEVMAVADLAKAINSRTAGGTTGGGGGDATRGAGGGDWGLIFR